MKSVSPVFLAILILFTACGGGAEAAPKLDSGKQEMVEAAIEEVKTYWGEAMYDDFMETDGYLEIKNTMIITLTEEAASMTEFLDMAFIVEFELYTDIYGSAPYYSNIKHYDTVVFYRSGMVMAQPRNPLVTYRSRTYQSDFTDIVE